MEEYEFAKSLYNAGDREVLLVTEKATGTCLVIKKIKINKMKEEEQAGTIKEVQALLKLKHRHIVSCISYFKGDLYDWIEKHRENKTSFATADIVRVLRQLCEALAYCHDQKILHRDIKPRNIFVEDNGTVKLGDFGIAKILESTSQDAETHNIGTRRYSAPEIFGPDSYRQKCDMWSLGCVLYEMITLEQPFQATLELVLISQISNDPYPPLPRHVDGNLVDLIAELLNKDPGKRPDAEHILARPFVIQQPSSQAASRVDFLQLMSTVDQITKTIEGLANQIEGMNKKIECLSSEFTGVNKKVECLSN